MDIALAARIHPPTVGTGQTRKEREPLLLPGLAAIVVCRRSRGAQCAIVAESFCGDRFGAPVRVYYDRSVADTLHVDHGWPGQRWLK